MSFHFSGSSLRARTASATDIRKPSFDHSPSCFVLPAFLTRMRSALDGVKFFEIELRPSWNQRLDECSATLDRALEDCGGGEVLWLGMKLYREMHATAPNELSVQSLLSELLGSVAQIPAERVQELPAWLNRIVDKIAEEYPERLDSGRSESGSRSASRASFAGLPEVEETRHWRVCPSPAHSGGVRADASTGRYDRGYRTRDRICGSEPFHAFISPIHWNEPDAVPRNGCARRTIKCSAGSPGAGRLPSEHGIVARGSHQEQ